jgi:putative NIF3 family GTP cyclohydrolase 1 type 2
LGLDAFISGEISEQTTHSAVEQGIHYFAAGHHATEKGGVQALGAWLAEHFGVEHHFIDIPNPA